MHLSAINLTLALALLLGVGILAAKAAQRIRLPSVSGYILAGLALGPSGFGLVSAEGIGHQLQHFTKIALMLIAFSIGEHIELRRLGTMARQVAGISLMQALATLLAVMLGVLAVTTITTPSLAVTHRLILALLLGAVAMTTSPAAVLVVVREQVARGPLTTALLGVVAMGDGIAIVLFGMALSVAQQLTGAAGGASPGTVLLTGMREIVFSLLCGAVTGLVLDFALRTLHRSGEILTAGLAVLLLCGELTRFLDLSPLLAGMAAGCTLINRSERDVRLFRAINAFEPPVLVLFFTLAGGHLDLAALRHGGWIGLIFILGRLAGKLGGTWLGARWSAASPLLRRHLGQALVPQAGVAIGLILLINDTPGLDAFSAIITPVVLAGVVLAEVVGPLLVRRTLHAFGESRPPDDETTVSSRPSRAGISATPQAPLHPAGRPEGVVAFQCRRAESAQAMARVATILAHHHHALPLAVRIHGRKAPDTEQQALLHAAAEEVRSLGYPLATETLTDEMASGLVAATEYNGAHALLLEYPGRLPPFFAHRVVNRVCRNVLCPVVLLRQTGAFHGDRVLVPYVHSSELEIVLPVLEALATVVHPRLTLLHLLASDSTEKEMEHARAEQAHWLYARFFDARVRQRVEASDCRTESIQRELSRHDLIVLAGRPESGLKRLLFGSLAQAVARSCHCTMLVVLEPHQQQSRVGRAAAL